MNNCRRAAERITGALSQPDWRPRRSNIEAARNELMDADAEIDRLRERLVDAESDVNRIHHERCDYWQALLDISLLDGTHDLPDAWKIARAALSTSKCGGAE